MTSLFELLEPTPHDDYRIIDQKLDKDVSAQKVDLSVGVYRDAKGDAFVLPCVAAAKRYLEANQPGLHDYTPAAGLPEFLKAAGEVAVGLDAVSQGRVASCQTIGGTGALSLGISFLTKCCGCSKVYLGTPAWTPYQVVVEEAGGELVPFRYYDIKRRCVDFENMLNTMKTAPPKSIFILQLCCHNPTGADLSSQQWNEIAQLMKDRQLIPFFDSAYQGFASGSTELDAAPIRKFISLEIEVLVAQSFSKNLGLYGERIGCLHVVTSDSKLATLAADKIRYIFSCQCASGPAFPSRIVSTVANDPKLNSQWIEDVKNMSDRLVKVRSDIYRKITEDYKTPGGLGYIKNQRGLYWYIGLNEKQTEKMMDVHHVYPFKGGRICIAGVNESNIDVVCRAFDDVMRNS